MCFIVVDRTLYKYCTVYCCAAYARVCWFNLRCIHTLTVVLSFFVLFAPSVVPSRSRNFDTPLHFAAFKGEADIADLLVQLGAGAHTRATTRAGHRMVAWFNIHDSFHTHMHGCGCVDRLCVLSPFLTRTSSPSSSLPSFFFLLPSFFFFLLPSSFFLLSS